MKPGRKILLGFLLAMAGLLALWGKKHRGDPASPTIHPTIAALPVVQTETPAPAAPAPREPADVTARREALKKYLLAQHPASIESRLERRDPFIARFRLLDRRKVLLKAEEKSELADILSDHEKWTNYEDYLSRVDFAASAVADEQMYRLFLLQYFESLLRTHKDAAVIEFLIGFVLNDNFGSDLSKEVKKMLAYEKIKVLGLLQQYSPDSLAIIRQKMVGLRHENLLRDSLEHAS